MNIFILFGEYQSILWDFMDRNLLLGRSKFLSQIEALT
jgi:hypothetical protein